MNVSLARWHDSGLTIEIHAFAALGALIPGAFKFQFFGGSLAPRRSPNRNGATSPMPGGFCAKNGIGQPAMAERPIRAREPEALCSS
jgi:hypothetical protein